MAAAISLSHNYLAEANSIMKEVREQVTCSEHYIDTTTLKGTTILENFQHHGEAYLQLITHRILGYKIRAASVHAVKSAQADNSLTPRIVARLGVGECSEMASLVALRCMKQKIPISKIICSEGLELGKSNENHVFVVVNPEKSPIKLGKNPFDTLSKIPGGILIDPLLNLACPLTELAGTSFERYMRAKGINTILKSSHIEAGSRQELKLLEKTVNTLHKKAQKTLKKFPEWLVKSLKR